MEDELGALGGEDALELIDQQHVAEHRHRASPRGSARAAPSRARTCRSRGDRRARGAPARRPATWRQSSEPIEPAAPVTSTVLPATSAATRGRSRRTGSRASRSSTFTSRICVYITRPSTSSRERRQHAVAHVGRACSAGRRGGSRAPGAEGMRDQHLADLVRRDQRRQIVDAAEHRRAADAQPDLRADRRRRSRRRRPAGAGGCSISCSSGCRPSRRRR